MTYTVDKDISPPAIGPRGRVSKYPFASMEVGDSFRFEHDAHLRSTVANTARQAFPDWRFTTQSVIEDGKRHFRIWRIK